MEFHHSDTYKYQYFANPLHPILYSFFPFFPGFSLMTDQNLQNLSSFPNLLHLTWDNPGTRQLLLTARRLCIVSNGRGHLQPQREPRQGRVFSGFRIMQIWWDSMPFFIKDVALQDEDNSVISRPRELSIPLTSYVI